MAAGTRWTTTTAHRGCARWANALARPNRLVVIACSALKRKYRDMIRAQAPGTVFIHLHGTVELLTERMSARPGHFMPVGLLESQLATLEPLEMDEAGVMLDIAATPAQLAQEAAAWLDARA